MAKADDGARVRAERRRQRQQVRGMRQISAWIFESRLPEARVLLRLMGQSATPEVVGQSPADPDADSASINGDKGFLDSQMQATVQLQTELQEACVSITLLQNDNAALNRAVSHAEASATAARCQIATTLQNVQRLEDEATRSMQERGLITEELADCRSGRARDLAEGGKLKLDLDRAINAQRNAVAEGETLSADVAFLTADAGILAANVAELRQKCVLSMRAQSVAEAALETERTNSIRSFEAQERAEMGYLSARSALEAASADIFSLQNATSTYQADYRAEAERRRRSEITYEAEIAKFGLQSETDRSEAAEILGIEKRRVLEIQQNLSQQEARQSKLLAEACQSLAISHRKFDASETFYQQQAFKLRCDISRLAAEIHENRVQHDLDISKLEQKNRDLEEAGRQQSFLDSTLIRFGLARKKAL